MDKLLKPTLATRALFFIFSDIIFSIISLYFSYLLRFNFNIPENFLPGFSKALIILIVIKLFFLYIFKIYFIAWRFFSLSDAKKLYTAIFLSYLIFGLIFYIKREFFGPFPRSVIFIDFFLFCVFAGFIRILKRLFLERKNLPKKKPTLIIGANNKTNNIIKSALNNEIDLYPVAIVEDKKELINTFFSGIKVFSFKDLEDIITKNSIETVIISKDLKSKQLNELFEKLQNFGIKEIKIATIFQDDKPIKEISIEDLLARKPEDLDLNLIKSFVSNKTILITGAGGSIGSEIARQCKKFNAKQLIFIDNSEFNLYKISEEIPDAIKKLISITSKNKLEEIIKTYKPDIIIHAAAYKHVHICEENIDECIENNIVGSMNVIDLAIKHSIKKLIIISTDKAVKPTSIMGASKRIVEIYAQNIDNQETDIIIVRFGNVLGSSGSVIPKFKEQIEKGGPITVTHPEVTRYFMLTSEACQLVLQAGAMAKGGEIYILDMGEPVKILDLAKKMIKIYNKPEIEIVFTGLRDGEKLHEELMKEGEEKTRYKSILIGKKTYYDITKLKKDIDLLIKAEKTEKIDIIKKIIPEYNPNRSQNGQS